MEAIKTVCLVACAGGGAAVLLFLAYLLAHYTIYAAYRLGVVPRACVGYWVNRKQYHAWLERKDRK